MASLQDVMQGVTKEGRLTEYGRENAYYISRTMDYYTAQSAALLYAEVARLVALRMAAEAMPGKGGER